MRGRRTQADQIDLWCQEWARQRRIALGIIEPKMIEPKERIGKLICTLARVRSERDGASYSRNSQSFPEVYTETALLVHRGYWQLRPEQRMAMHLHYVWREIPVSAKAPQIPASPTRYWELVGQVKSFLQGYLASLPADALADAG